MYRTLLSCLTKEEITVGRQVYIKLIGNAALRSCRGKNLALECTVTRKGRKYFYVTPVGQSGIEHKVAYENFEHYDTNENSGVIVYASLEEFETEVAYIDQYAYIRDYFNRGRIQEEYGLSPEKMSQIYEIVCTVYSPKPESKEYRNES